MKQSQPDMPARGFDIIAEVTTETLKAESDALNEQIFPLYAKYYSEEDLDNLIAFYKTPTGQKVIQTMPALLQESMQIGQRWGQQLIPEIESKIKEKLISEGIISE